MNYIHQEIAYGVIAMGRRRKGIWIPKDVLKMADIIALFLNKHASGFLVLCGKCPWPDLEELNEMLRYVNGGNSEALGVRVQGGVDIPLAQRHVEAIESAEWVYRFLDRYGGTVAVAASMQEYHRARPQEYELLRRIGMAGQPGAKSIESLAGEFYMDVKTLYARKQQAIVDIAFDVVCGGENFELAE